VMEYAEEDLAAVLRERTLSSEEARNVLESVLEVLSYLHGQGLVHSRLKPANILAVSDRLKISCDGIRTSGELPLASETIDGYDPPEALNEGYSPAADIWSLGITLVEALTQRLPGPEGPDQKRILPETLPVEFREIIDSCLQADPLKRATIGSLSARLRPDTGDISHDTAGHIVEPSMAKPREASWRWRYAVPAAALGLATMFATISVMHRRAETPQAASQPPVQGKVQEQPERKPVRPSTAEPATAQPTLPTGSADRMAPRGSATSVVPAPPSAKAKSSDHPGVVHQVMPDVPGKARETIRGTVRIGVRAHVDSSGRVTGAELASAGPSSYFAQLALQAARRWQFEPASAQTQDAASVWLLKFELTRGGTKVRPVRVSP